MTIEDPTKTYSKVKATAAASGGAAAAVAWVVPWLQNRYGVPPEVSVAAAGTISAVFTWGVGWLKKELVG